ncbi:MAG: AAA family ATPase [Candidatus Methanoperedens sp.]
MYIEITIKNYRCFPDSKQAKILLGKGFTSFVGVNNSGKSSLLKFFYEFRSLFKSLTLPHISNGVFIAALNPDTPPTFDIAPSISDIEEIFCNLNNRDIEIEIRDLEATRDNPLIPNRIDFTIIRGTNRFSVKLYLKNGPVKFIKNTMLNLKGSILREKTTHIHEDGSTIMTPKADISGVFQIFQALSETLYIGPFRNAINVVAEVNYYDIQIGKNFIQNWRTWKTGNLRKQNEAIIRLTDSIKHIFDYDVLEINPSEDVNNIKVFINGKSYKLSELGSGLTQFILVLANAAIKRPSYILIDEPELNLHPSLQLDFLTTLGSYASEGVLFATHSIGLARASAEKIYSVRKVTDGESEIFDLEDTPRFSELLGELSFSGYRELGSDKVLLVEGTTDVKTIQQFLRLLKIDHKILVLPMGGNSLINDSSEEELAEITRISENIFALIDSERATSEAQLDSKRAAFVQICAKIGIRCHVLDRRASENYFSDGAIKKIKGNKYRALEPYEKLNEISPSWSKAENWKIAREMTLDDLNTTDLGKFLSTLKDIEG